MTLVNADTGEVVAECTADEARDLTDRIKFALEGTWQLVVMAFESRAWAALGYRSWDDYCTREFGQARLKLPREEREEVVGSLRDAGLSIRAIVAATGASDQTVQRDLARCSDSLHLDPEPAAAEPVQVTPRFKPGVAPKAEPAPKKVTGTDGKTYPAKPKAEPKKPQRGPFMADVPKAGWDLRKTVERIERIAADDRFTANKEQVAAQWSDHLAHAVKVCQDLLGQLNTEPQEAR